MALSQRTKDILVVAMADRRSALELASAIDTGANPKAASIAALGVTTNLSALVVTASVPTPLATGNTYTDAALNASFTEIAGFLNAKADNADVETLRTQAEARLDAIEAKIDAVIAALKAAALMA